MFTFSVPENRIQTVLCTVVEVENSVRVSRRVHVKKVAGRFFLEFLHKTISYNYNILPLILSAILLCKATETYSLACSCYLVNLAKRFLMEFYFSFLFFCVFCSVSIIAAHRGGHRSRDAIYIYLLNVS